MHRVWLYAFFVGVLGCDDGGGGADADADLDGDADNDLPLCTDDEGCSDGAFCNGSERCDPEDAAADDRGCAPALEVPCLEGQTCDEGEARCLTECDLGADADGDGHDAIDCLGDDCDDADPNVYPGNTEVCDVEDHDEDCDPMTYGVRDADADGWPDARCCNEEAGGTRYCGTDCDDTVAVVHPTESEACDGLDNDCDGEIDNDLLRTYYPDADGDGYGDPAGAPLVTCDPPPSSVENNTDCDDTSTSRSPGLAEVCDGIDNDCDGEIDGPGEDDDHDGYADAECAGDLGVDCGDTDPEIHPGATERCNSLDDDCDGLFGVIEDADGDGFASAACGGDDCDDADPTMFPLGTWLGDYTIDDPADVEELRGYTALSGNMTVVPRVGTFEDLDGLECLNTVSGSITIQWNDAMEDLDGLAGLVSVGGALNISNNSHLRHLDGLSRLTSVGNTMSIESNSYLESITGLGSLTSLDGPLSIRWNGILPTCQAEALRDQLRAAGWDNYSFIEGNNDYLTCE